MRHQRVSDLRNDLERGDKYRDKLLGKGFVAAHLDDAHVRGTLGTGENEWYTPAKYIEMARKVLGEIDLDPASSLAANDTVKAKEWFDDGLTKPWRGRVWMNPPYAQPLIGQFITKLVEERSADNARPRKGRRFSTTATIKIYSPTYSRMLGSLGDTRVFQ
jgi:hypothetical protein